MSFSFFPVVLRQPPALPSDTETKPAPLNDSDLIVYYEALTGKLDTLYTQMDQVFADAALPEAKTEFQDAQVVLDQNKRATLQFRDVRLLPFDFDSVCEASWRCVNDEAVKGLEQGAGEVTFGDMHTIATCLVTVLMVRVRTLTFAMCADCCRFYQKKKICCF